MQTMKRCVNGCDAPPHPPSKVLCKECFARLDKKMRGLLERLDSVICARCDGTGEEDDDALGHPRPCHACGGRGTLVQ